MAEIIVQIPDYQYKRICKKDLISLRARNYTDIAICALNAVKNGIVLPDNATNGDVMEKVFGEQMAECVYHLSSLANWWSAPYKGEIDGN